MAKYFKTTFTITVLTEDRPVSDAADIIDVVRDFTDGDSIGQTERTAAIEVPADKIEEELLAVGNDGSFFSLGDEDEEREDETEKADTDEITYTDEDGAPVTTDDIAESFDKTLGECGSVFVRGSDGHRYLVSVRVTFERADED